jgi:hypothetical protein
MPGWVELPDRFRRADEHLRAGALSRPTASSSLLRTTHK